MDHEEWLQLVEEIKFIREVTGDPPLTPFDLRLLRGGLDFGKEFLSELQKREEDGFGPIST